MSTTIDVADRTTWPAPNYDNPESLDHMILGIIIPILILTAVFLCLRFYGKVLIRQRLGADDWAMLAATMFALPVSIFPLIQTKFGLGRYIWDVKSEWFPVYWKLMYAADLMFPSACSLNKISLLLTYLRLFPSRTNKIFCYVMSAFVTSLALAALLLSLLECKPIRSYWDQTGLQVCINTQPALLTLASLSCFSDVCVYLWPVKPLWSLQLPLKQRLGLIFLFSVGLIVCVAGILRATYLHKWFGTDQIYSTNGVAVWICMICEMDIGIICGCLSGVKPVVARLFPTIFGSSYMQKTGPSRPTYGPRTGPTGHSDSFAFEQLSSSKPRHKEYIEQIDADDTHSGGNKKTGNFAWAQSTGKMGIEPSVPTNRIAVNQEITVVDDGGQGSATPRSDSHNNQLTDSGSEEWIFQENGTKLQKL